MRCPADCDADLLLAERRGVEIDYCPRCRGIWLDRGELDKIIDRAAEEVDRIVERERTAAPASAPTPSAPPMPEWSSEYDDRGRDRWASSSGAGSSQRSERTGKKPKSKKKKAFDLLEDIFDF